MPVVLINTSVKYECESNPQADATSVILQFSERKRIFAFLILCELLKSIIDIPVFSLKICFI